MVDKTTLRLLEGYKRAPQENPEVTSSGKTSDRSDEWKVFEEKLNDALVRRERELAAEIDQADNPSEVKFKRSISHFVAYAGISRTSLYTDHADRILAINEMYANLDKRIQQRKNGARRVSVSSLQADMISLKIQARKDLETAVSVQISQLVDLLGSDAGRNRYSLLQEIQTLTAENRQLRDANTRLRKFLQTLGADLSGV